MEEACKSMEQYFGIVCTPTQLQQFYQENEVGVGATEPTPSSSSPALRNDNRENEMVGDVEMVPPTVPSRK